MKSLSVSAFRHTHLLSAGRLSEAMLAHEIRNPMWTIRTFASALSGKMADRNFLESFCKIVPREVERVSSLVEQLLDSARPQPVARNLIDVNETIAMASEVIAPKAAAAGVNIVMRLRARCLDVWADSAALQQIFNNLLDNSIDALAHKSGEREINIRASERSGMVIVEVEDNGPGIPVQAWPHLFCPFATFKKDEGTGLGLFIVSRIASDHGGTIRAMKHQGVGARFVLQLPLARMATRSRKRIRAVRTQ
jgi:C4-dicarboxylate-specific signal transduction histidine kinase